ncbi:hypothetical protein HK098_007109 [Nowakowskiella sp. JEL0407]|nr:hypothetical protein HK098_007109 [Nowakowskiella sp. JEL0407]
MGSLERLTQRQHPQHNVSPLGDFSSSNVQASTQKVTEAKYADLINRTAFSMSNATISLNTSSPTQEKLKSPNSKILNDLEISENFTDDEDFQVETNIEIIQPVSNSNAARVQKIKLSSSDVTKINRLLCPDGLTNRGNQIGSFGEEWKNKGFVFSSVEDLKYGLVQINGGPCGLLAAVQCYVLKNLLFKSKTSATKDNKLQFSLKQTQGALIEGLSEIIWKCSSRHRRALVVIIPKSDVSWDIYSTRMEVSQIDNLTELKQFISSNILSFTNNSGGYHGLIQLLISVILSRGLDVIQNEDMDEPECKLIGKHGYCTQELVNLIVLGKAISNVFDGDVRLGDNSNFKVLKGVGEYYKNPEYPIFIVCSESHFTVLFSATTPIPELSPTRNIDLIYYDGLANQDSEMKLTLSVLPRIKNGRFLSNSREVEDSDVPPLELCIGTKWTNAVVDWNGTDPIL